ncbi:MAG: hypothetical protein GYA62_15315 [Bacteroidales bacterium]|nr:hypothetical protein [Bacteroidales bacterium]
MNPLAARLIDWRIFAVVIGFLILIFFFLKPKSDKQKAKDEEERGKAAGTQKVKNAYSLNYGLEMCKKKNIKPSEYIKQVKAPDFLDFVKNVKNIKFTNIIPDPLNLTPSQKLRQIGINYLYKLETITVWSLFSKVFFDETKEKLETFLRSKLTEAESYKLDKHINSLKDF